MGAYLADFAINNGWPDVKTYENINDAKIACITLEDGCVGITVSASGIATLRSGSSFQLSPSGETSYMKSSCEKRKYPAFQIKTRAQCILRGHILNFTK